MKDPGSSFGTGCTCGAGAACAGVEIAELAGACDALGTGIGIVVGGDVTLTGTGGTTDAAPNTVPVHRNIKMQITYLNITSNV